MGPAELLSRAFDAVVMLTWSDWRTELRSNRFNYATRFTRYLPVVFVQPDLTTPCFEFEDSDTANIVILHVFETYGRVQTDLLRDALYQRGVCQPLLWIYNCWFSLPAIEIDSRLKVYHATEDYFADFNGLTERVDELKLVLRQTDLLVALSDGIARAYGEQGGYHGPLVVLPNGCDFAFWSPTETELTEAGARQEPGRTVFYQGGINKRLDFELLHNLVNLLPDWTFVACGHLAPDQQDQWAAIARKPNVQWLGRLDPTRVRNLAQQATVGIIPFKDAEAFMNGSRPLKAFEYVAAGLPVVSTPVAALGAFPSLFRFAASAEEFAAAIRDVAPSRTDPDAIRERLCLARAEDYDVRFETLLEAIAEHVDSAPDTSPAANVLVLYDADATRVATADEHLRSFGRFSRHRVFYAQATGDADCLTNLSHFDAVVLHSSVRVSLDWHLAPAWATALAGYRGLKVLFIQDEYDTTETARRWIEQLGIQAVFSCAPPAAREVLYPPERFPSVEFRHTLTGFVPARLAHSRPRRPLASRRWTIGYRGRELPFWYGRLGYEKMLIGQVMRRICDERGIPNNIEWADDKRIYGPQWYKFLEECRAVLGTESGSNVLDEYGHVARCVKDALEERPDLTFEDVATRCLEGHDGRIEMNQISPKIFEAIGTRSALVLFEGRYSDIIEPDRHYIPLRKDFSNVDEVLRRLEDLPALGQMTDRAFADVVASGRYGYPSFVAEFDNWLSSLLPRRRAVELVSVVVGVRDPGVSSVRSVVRPGDVLDGLPTSWPATISRPWHLRVFADDVKPRSISVDALLDGLRYGTGLGRGVRGRAANLALVARLTTRAPGLRPLAKLIVVRAGMAKDVSRSDVLSDFVRLAVLIDARRGALPDQQFHIVVQFDPNTGRLGFRSENRMLDDLEQGAHLRWIRDARAATRAHLVREVVWDHSDIADHVMYPVIGSRQLWVSLGVRGVHEFRALNAMAQARPEQARPVLLALLSGDGVTPAR